MIISLLTLALASTPSPDASRELDAPGAVRGPLGTGAADRARWEQHSLQIVGDRLGPLPDHVALEATHTLAFAGGWRTRVSYRVQGLPVRGASQVVAASRGGAARVSGPPVRWPDAVEPVTTRGEALDVAAGHAVSAPHVAELAWLARDGELTLAWRVPVLRGHGVSPSPHDVWVDAGQGELLALVPTGHYADALAYGENPETSMVERWTLSGSDLTSSYARASSCVVTDDDPDAFALAGCEVAENQAAPDASGDFLFVPRPTAPRDPFAEVNAFVHTDHMARWLVDRWDLRLPWGPIDVFVNFPLSNAFFGDFDGDGQPDISFGQTSLGDVAYDADVVYHELGHGVVATLAPDLPFLQADETGMDWVSGSVNEGAADAFALLLAPDGQLGEYAGLVFGKSGPTRDLSHPRHCPRDLVGEVHADGEIFGSFFWQLMLDDRVGVETAGELLVGAIALWDADPSWPRVGETLTATADDLLASSAIDAAAYDAIRGHLDVAGMDGCDRVVSLSPTDSHSLRLVNVGLQGDLAYVVGSVQLRLDPQEPMEVTVDRRGGDPRLEWSVFVRRGAPVRNDVLPLSGLGLTLAVPAEYDELIDGQGDEVALSLEPGDGPVWLLFASRNEGLAGGELETVTVEVAAEVVETSDPPSRPYGAPAPVVTHEPACATGGAPGGFGAVLLGLIATLRGRTSRR